LKGHGKEKREKWRTPGRENQVLRERNVPLLKRKSYFGGWEKDKGGRIAPYRGRQFNTLKRGLSPSKIVGGGT